MRSRGSEWPGKLGGGQGETRRAQEWKVEATCLGLSQGWPLTGRDQGPQEVAHPFPVWVQAQPNGSYVRSRKLPSFPDPRSGHSRPDPITSQFRETHLCPTFPGICPSPMAGRGCVSTWEQDPVDKRTRSKSVSLAGSRQWGATRCQMSLHCPQCENTR